MRSVAWFSALGLGAMLVTPLSAQDPTFGIGLGRSLGGSAFFGHYIGDEPAGGEPGGAAWQLQTYSEWSLVEVPVTFRAEALYSRLEVNPSVDHWFATVGSILSPRPGVDGFQPYAIAGGALFLNRSAGGSVSEPRAPADRWAWVPGVNVGAGFAFDVLSLRPGLEIRRHQGVFEDDRSGWVSISLLLRFP